MNWNKYYENNENLKENHNIQKQNNKVKITKSHDLIKKIVSTILQTFFSLRFIYLCAGSFFMDRSEFVRFTFDHWSYPYEQNTPVKERRWFSLIVFCSVVSYFIVRACGLWTTFQAIPRIKYKSKHILHCSVNFSSIYCGITIELFASTKIYSLFFF